MVFLLGILGLSAGCSTVVSKAGLDPAYEAQIGNPYSGFRFNLKSWRCLPSAAGDYSPVVNVLFVPLSVSLLVADLPFSLVADTAILPVDLVVAPGAEPVRPRTDDCE
jgi:uncharacterized protein YceK